MEVVFVTAKKAGKGQNAIYLKQIVALLIVQEMVTVSMVRAIARLAGKEKFVMKEIVKIQIVLNTVLAYMVSATVKPDGRVPAVTLSMNKCTNACQHAQIMVYMT